MLKITSKGIPEVRAWLQRIALGAKTLATRSVAEYLVGDMSHGLKHYVPYQYVTVEQAGGWKSEKQRRYVMAMIKEGKIDPGVPHRTGRMQRAWDFSAEGSRFKITNSESYTQYVMGDVEQSRMHGIIGWRVIGEVIKNNLKGAFRHATAQVKKWLKTQKK